MTSIQIGRIMGEHVVQTLLSILPRQFRILCKLAAMRVLILDNALHRFLFKPSWHWKALLRGVPTDVVNVPSGHRIPPLDRYTHLILTGSEASITAPRPWYGTEAHVIRKAADRGLSILGSCFGHQLLVHALSGSEFLRRAEQPEVGWITLEKLADDDLLADVPSPWYVFTYHFDEVVDPPDPWIVLARSQRCPVHVIRYGEQPIWGIQAHPEISRKKAQFFTRWYLLQRGHAARKVITAIRCPPHDDQAMASIVQRFLNSQTNTSLQAAGTSDR